MILVDVDLCRKYYRWIADKYDISFSEAIAHDDKCNSKDWPEFQANQIVEELDFDWD